MINKHSMMAFFLSACCLFSTCSLMDFSKLSVSCYPEEENTVIDIDDPVWVDFDRDIAREEAERIASVRTFNGSVLCDTSWTGNRLTFVPVEGWRPGILYYFTIKGQLQTMDGLKFTVFEKVSFFAGSSSDQPYLISGSPAHDEIVERNTPIELRFSKPVSDTFLKEYISVIPSSDFAVSLEESGHLLVITPANLWKGMTRYEWRVSDKFMDTEGIGLYGDASGHFRTFADTEPPDTPILYSADIMDTSAIQPIDYIRKDTGILLVYNEEVNMEGLLKLVSFDPSFSVQNRIINAFTLLLFPDDGLWIPDQEYTMLIKAGVADASGNLTEEDLSFTFTSAIPPLTVTGIRNIPDAPVDFFTEADFANGNPLPFGILPDAEHTFEIEFSLPFTAREAEKLLSSISVEAIFPSYISGSLALYSSILTTDPGNRAVLSYRGFPLKSYYDYGIPEERYFFQLSIRGGKQGFILDNGSCLSEDFSIILELIEL